jgi:hypothetical protein
MIANADSANSTVNRIMTAVRHANKCKVLSIFVRVRQPDNGGQTKGAARSRDRRCGSSMQQLLLSPAQAYAQMFA